MSETEPTRERVEAMQRGLDCRAYDRSDRGLRAYCAEHRRTWTDLGCPVAVAAARVEAERVSIVKCDAAAKALRGAARTCYGVVTDWPEMADWLNLRAEEFERLAIQARGRALLPEATS